MKKLFLQSVVLLVATMNFAAHGAKAKELPEKQETFVAQPNSPEFREFFRFVAPMILDVFTGEETVKQDKNKNYIELIKFKKDQSSGTFLALQSQRTFKFLNYGPITPELKKMKKEFTVYAKINEVNITGNWGADPNEFAIDVNFENIPIDKSIFANSPVILAWKKNALIKDLQTKVSEILTPLTAESVVQEHLPSELSGITRQYLSGPTQAEKDADTKWENDRQKMNAEIEAKFPSKKAKEEPKKSGLEE